MGRIGTAELIIILVVLLLLFGARRIPDIARSIGRSMNQFKKGLRETDIEDMNTSDDKDETKGDN